MIAAFAFVITLMIPSFGGEVTVTIQSRTQDGCWKARRAAQTMLRDQSVRATVSECAETK